MTDDPSDGELVVVVQGGGPGARSAFDALARRHQNWLYGYLLHVLRDPGLADDSAQEALVKAWLQIDKLDHPERFRAWLRVIGTRVAFNARRGRITRSDYEARTPGPRYQASGEDALAADEALDLILDQLPYPYREVLVLRYVEGLTVHEMSEVLDLGQSAVKMRLKRARDEFEVRYKRVIDDAT